MNRRIALFVAVGCIAAAVHWSFVLWSVGRWGWHALAANVCGWLLAFPVSFAGHRYMTFRERSAAAASAAVRFLGLSAGAFAANEATYAAALHFSPEHYGLALAVVLASVALGTYLLSSRWVFGQR